MDRPEVTLRNAVVLLIVAAAAGCAQSPLPVLHSGANPDDAKSGAAPAAYRPVTAGTVSHQPVEPKPWRDMNDRVAPGAGRSQ